MTTCKIWNCGVSRTLKSSFSTEGHPIKKTDFTTPEERRDLSEILRKFRIKTFERLSNELEKEGKDGSFPINGETRDQYEFNDVDSESTQIGVQGSCIVFTDLLTS